MAITIEASPEQVWPWLVQMGWDRGGWYSWDLLDDAGRRSATEVHPDWQDLAIGDQLKFWALGRVMDAYRVAVIEPNRFLGLYGYTDLLGRWLDRKEPRPSSYMEALWGFRLDELPRWAHPPRDQRLPSVPPSMGRTVHRLLAPHLPLLAHEGSDDGSAQAEHRARANRCFPANDDDPLRSHEASGLSTSPLDHRSRGAAEPEHEHAETRSLVVIPVQRPHREFDWARSAGAAAARGRRM